MHATPAPRRFRAIASRHGTFDRGARGYEATLTLGRMESMLLITVDGDERTELVVEDVDALIRDLRQHSGTERTAGLAPASGHRIAVIASDSTPANIRRLAGVLRLRRDDELGLTFVRVTIDGRDGFECGFQDTDGVLDHLRRLAPPGPRHLRDVLRGW